MGVESGKSRCASVELRLSEPYASISGGNPTSSPDVSIVLGPNVNYEIIFPQQIEGCFTYECSLDSSTKDLFVLAVDLSRSLKKP